jgi:hypothetical protein
MELIAGEKLEENDAVYVWKDKLYKISVRTPFGLKDTFGITKYNGQISNKYVPPFRQIAENYFISRGE